MIDSAGEHPRGAERGAAAAEADRPGLGGGDGRGGRGRRGGGRARRAAARARAARVRAARVRAGPPARARLGRLGGRRLLIRLSHWGNTLHFFS